MDNAIPTRSVEPPLQTRAQVAERLGISVRQFDRLVASTSFPTPIRIGPRSPRWRESDINAYVASVANAVK